MAQITRFFAECASLAAQATLDAGPAIADALLRACDALSDEQFDRLERTAGATPDDVALALREAHFADRVPGAYLPAVWLETFCATLEVPLAEVEGGWTVSDGEASYFCPVVQLADDPDSPRDTRGFVQVDAIRTWTEPGENT
jgi:hypothetical protein